MRLHRHHGWLSLNTAEVEDRVPGSSPKRQDQWNQILASEPEAILSEGQRHAYPVIELHVRRLQISYEGVVSARLTGPHLAAIPAREEHNTDRLGSD